MKRAALRAPAVSTPDECARLAAGLSGLAVTALIVRRDRVGWRETRTFRLVNDLPDVLFPPTWVIMQLGSLATVPVVATLAQLSGRPRLARRLILGGLGAWALSKAVKRVVRRPRPSMLLAGTRRRGGDASGLGYVSGHAGVAVALAVALVPHAGRRGRWLMAAAVPWVGLARIYVGAHLPLDVLGGAALGLAVEAAIGLAEDDGGSGSRPPAVRSS